MADNLNTPSLPEVKPVSRRHVIAGAGAVLSAMTGAAMAGATTASSEKLIAEAEFADRCRKWHLDHEAVEQAYENVSTISDELEDLPMFPPELRGPLVAIDGTVRQPGEQYRNGVPSLCWSAKDLQDIIYKGGFWHCHAIHDGDSMTMTSGIKPLSTEEIKRAAEMLPIAVLHEQARLDALERGRAMEEVPNEMNRRLWDDAIILLATPATCIASLMYKVAIARNLELFNPAGDDAEDVAIAGIMSDIEALAGEVQS